jgi:hypothetical protein
VARLPAHRTDGEPPGTTRARDGLPKVRRVGPEERYRLHATFGSLLRSERGYRSVEDVAAAAGMNPTTIKRLEAGWRRPATSSVWKLARALRPKGTLRDRVALDERLRRAAGSSLRDAATRPRRRREAVREQLLAEADGGVVLGDHDETLGGALVAELSRMFDSTPATQPDEAR